MGRKQRRKDGARKEKNNQQQAKHAETVIQEKHKLFLALTHVGFLRRRSAGILWDGVVRESL